MDARERAPARPGAIREATGGAAQRPHGEQDAGELAPPLMVGEGRQRHLERTQGDADGQHRADERAQPGRAQRPEEVARRLVAPCGPAFLARQDGEQGERAGHHRRPRDRERRTRRDERDEQRGEERPDDEIVSVRTESSANAPGTSAGSPPSSRGTARASPTRP